MFDGLRLFVFIVALSLAHRHRDGLGNVPQCGVRPNLTAVVQAVTSSFRTLKPRALLFQLSQNGETLYSDALGFAQPGVPATTDLRFRVGGITEPFLSTLYFMLLERGLVNPSLTIDAWFPWVVNSEIVTLGMLAANQAGFADYARSADFASVFLANPFRVFSVEELVAFGNASKTGPFQIPKYAPGTSQAYSHTEMLLLYLVIERQTGRTIADLYDAFILKPNKLTSTSSPAPLDNSIPSPALHAFETTTGSALSESTFWSTSWFQGYGILLSTIGDVSSFGRLLCTGALISRENFQRQIAFQGFGNPNPHYGYGIVVDNDWLFQNPSLNGFYGAFACNLRNGLVVVAASTKDESTVDVNVAFKTLQDVVNIVTPASPIL